MLARVARSILRAVTFAGFERHCAPVLNYHACFRKLPPNVSPLDNITPDWLYQHLSALKRHFTLVSIDELSVSKRPRGIAAVTFDDGYKSVVEEALPIFVALDVPFTMFINISSLERKIFWRHKVLYIQQHGLVQECETSLLRTKKVNGLDFYSYLKHPSNNSRVVEGEVDAFLQTKQLSIGQCDYLIDSPDCFVKHPLVWYGNHGHNHYVMSSLSYAEQVEEIASAKEYLHRQPGMQVSGVFSLPFGEARHINRATFMALQDSGYKALAMNRGLLNSRIADKCGVRVIERFSPVGQPLEWQIKKRFAATLAGGRKDPALDRSPHALKGPWARQRKQS
jgi:peptidoglycan/xylan/chitin deacetylase (PgdA/CDA1 family)